MKVKFLNQHFYGKELSIPDAGTVEIPADGIVELSDETAKIMVEGSPEWEYIEEEGEGEEEKVEISEEKKALLESIDQMSLEELVSLCSESTIKGWQKFQKNEKALRSYVKNQFLKQ